MDLSIPEAVGLLVAVLLAMGLLTLLIHVKAAEAGVSGARRRRAIASIWLIVGGSILLLFALRALSGGPVAGGSVSDGLWMQAEPRQMAALAGVLVVLVVGMVLLRRVLNDLEVHSTPPAPPMSIADDEDP